MSRPALAAALLVVEYLTVSFLFDAKELVPASFTSLGDVAPLPVIAVVAFLILRSAGPTSAPQGWQRAAAQAGLSRAAGAALLAAHGVAYAAFLAACFFLRGRAGAAPVAASVGWAALGGISVALLAAFAFARRGFAQLARRAAAPLALGAVVGVAAWAAGRGTGALWFPLARVTLEPVRSLVALVAGDVVADPARFLVGTQRFYVRVDPICSGYEGMGLVAVLVGAALWTFRRTLRFPRAFGVLAAAVFLAFAANVARIAALIVVGTYLSPAVAVGGFHSKAGWLFFSAIALGATLVLRRARVLQRAPGAVDDDGWENPTAGYLAPLFALVGGFLVGGLFSRGGLDHLELVALGAAAVCLWFVRGTVRAALPGPWSPAGFVAGAVAFALWWGIDAVTSADAVAQAAALKAQLDAWSPAHAGVWIATRVAASVIVAPLVEELAFRGFLLRRIVAADFTAVPFEAVGAVAVVVSSAAFGALQHRALAGGAAGLVYALVAKRTGRLRDAVVAHAVTGALVAALVLGQGRFDLWA